MTEVDLRLLTVPFPENEIEWRVGQCGKKGNGQLWATCLAYVQARAIMNRLDEVVGAGGWKVSYRSVAGSDAVSPGVMCELSIFVNGQWVTKEDGAEQTDIESFKGGISAALKRAGSVWGIGRYLYGLDQGFAQIVDRGGDGTLYGKTKDGTTFHWLPPRLPQWALPSGHKAVHVSSIHPSQPGREDGSAEKEAQMGYRIPFGKFVKRSLEDIDLKDLRDYVSYLEGKAAKEGKAITGVVGDFVQRATAYIAAFENTPLTKEGAKESDFETFGKEPGQDG
jgi:hypothetical protein